MDSADQRSDLLKNIPGLKIGTEAQVFFQRKVDIDQTLLFTQTRISSYHYVYAIHLHCLQVLHLLAFNPGIYALSCLDFLFVC